MKPEEGFKQLLREVASELRRHGFTRNGQRFYLQDDGNWGLISFQKSTRSTPLKLMFTVNLGVASARLLRFFPPARFRVAEGKAKPLDPECHWRQRLGYVLPEKQDEWWSMTSGTDLDQLAGEIQGYLINLAVPQIQKHISDQALLELWLSGESPGLTQLQRLEYLSVLLKGLGPRRLLEQTLEELRHTSRDAEIHIARLMKESVI